MADENGTVGKRDHGRQLAIDGILYSRFGARPCTAAEDALRALRSQATRPATRRKRDVRDPRRRPNGRRRAVPPSSGSWPMWIKVGLAVAAGLLLLLTVRLVLQNGEPEGGGTRRFAGQSDEFVKRDLGADAVGSPEAKKPSQPERIDPDQELARQLAWTEGFQAGGPPVGRGGLKTGRPEPVPGFGGTDIADGAVEGGLQIGSPRTGGGKGGIRGGPPVKDGGRPGGPPLGGGGVGKGTDAPDLDAAVATCVQKLSFKLRIPRELPGGYQLTGLNPKGTGDGVMLLYARGDDVARIFVSPFVGPDTSFTRVKMGNRQLLTAHKQTLLIAIENGPTEARDCEEWATLLVSR